MENLRLQLIDLHKLIHYSERTIQVYPAIEKQCRMIQIKIGGMYRDFKYDKRPEEIIDALRKVSGQVTAISTTLSAFRGRLVHPLNDKNFYDMAEIDMKKVIEAFNELQELVKHDEVVLRIAEEHLGI